ncbi:MAG: alpha-L-fucosidase [Puniceicoccales bacterium]|jgi:alpha-L-fucosidase|nr:alpha-L-fucosidase [Puniceicoccales bacterium]
MKAIRILTLLALAAVSQAHTPLPAQEMDKMWGEQDDSKSASKRGRFFETGNYAMFVHWGLYSKIANKWQDKTHYGIGEWIMNPAMANISVADYKAIAKDFNPVDFDAKKLAALAKAAGMKYIVITSKHHDGFAMYHSKANKFNVVDATPFKRDPLKELSEACKELGLGLGFYYSHNQDWTYPGGGKGPTTDADGKNKTFDDYFAEKCLPQVEEITKNYGEIELVWFDTPGKMPRKYAQKLVEVVHRNQPRTLVSGRVGYGLGDYRTFGDMEVPLENVDGLWEGVDVTNDSWGFAWYDENWKSPKQILTTLIATVARGGTYMLNVGPDGQGRVPEPAQQALRTAGAWIAQHPQVIYNTASSPWKHALPWGDVTRSKNTLHLAVSTWPTTGGLHLPGLKTEIASARIADGNGGTRELRFHKEGTWTTIETPDKAPDKLVSVIELALKGPPEVDIAQAVDPEFGLTLSARFSKAQKASQRYKRWMEKFGEWKHMHQVGDWKEGGSATWEFEVKTPGYYLVELTYTADGPRVWRVVSGEGAAIQNRQNGSGIYHTQPIGWIKFEKAGRQTLTVSIPEGQRDATSLSAIKITPVAF